MMLIHSICMAFIGFGRFKKVDIVIRLIAAIDLKVKGTLFFNRINFLVTEYYKENTLTRVYTPNIACYNYFNVCISKISSRTKSSSENELNHFAIIHFSLATSS